MSSINDENEFKKCLEEIIEIIEKTTIEESSYTNETNVFNSNKIILDDLTNIINEKLKVSLDFLSPKSRQYFLDLFQDYNYSYEKGSFNETIKGYIIKQLLNDLSAIKDSFDAFQAAFNGNLPIVKHFIEKYPKYKDKSGIWGTTLLYSASRNNHIHIVKYLIEQGKCNVNAQNRQYYLENKQINPTSGSTPLHAACFYGHLNIVKYLIDNGADYFIQNDMKETPIYNGLLRDNIAEFFQNYLIFSYKYLTHLPPESTILSKYLLEMIYECGGSSVRSAINNQIEKKLKNSLTSVKADGDIKSSRIYFIDWQVESHIDLIKKSLENLISISMQKAHDDNYRIIAFPAIGCGHYKYPLQIVAQTMVNKAHQEQILHQISVSFIIQPTKNGIFNHFEKQINLLNQSKSMDFVSTIIQNSLIQIEKGDITKQKVNYILKSNFFIPLRGGVSGFPFPPGFRSRETGTHFRIYFNQF